MKAYIAKWTIYTDEGEIKPGGFVPAKIAETLSSQYVEAVEVEGDEPETEAVEAVDVGPIPGKTYELEGRGQVTVVSVTGKTVAVTDGKKQFNVSLSKWNGVETG